MGETFVCVLYNVDSLPFWLSPGYSFWLQPEYQPTYCPSASKTNLQTTAGPDFHPGIVADILYIELQLASRGLCRYIQYKHHELRFVNFVAAKWQFSSNTYLAQTWLETNIAHRNDTCFPSPQVVMAMLTSCCRKWGDIVLYKHCFLAVSLHFRHGDRHSPSRTYAHIPNTVCVWVRCNYELTSRIKIHFCVALWAFSSSCLVWTYSFLLFWDLLWNGWRCLIQTLKPEIFTGLMSWISHYP